MQNVSHGKKIMSEIKYSPIRLLHMNMNVKRLHHIWGLPETLIAESF